MITKVSRADVREKKHYRLRKNINGTAEMPRFCVFKSNNYVYAQIIDDEAGVTLVSASTLESDLKSKVENTGNVEAAKLVGETIAKRAIEKGISKVVFDRSGYIYHGKVQALADAAREAGLKF